MINAKEAKFHKNSCLLATFYDIIPTVEKYTHVVSQRKVLMKK
jgi:hypothetical protein